MTPSEIERHNVFLRLYVTNEESLRSFVRALVPTIEDSRDVMQQVAAVLWRKFEDLGSESEFRKWAFGVARLEALQFRRTKARDRLIFDESVLELLADAADEAADTLTRERSVLEHCVSKLPEAHRVLVQAAYAPGVRIEDLALQLGRTAMSLYKTLHRIRMSLMECTRRALSEAGS